MYERELNRAKDVAVLAGKIHMKNLGRVGVEYKGRELVTESDREANEFILHELSPFGHGIVSEEADDVETGSPLKWYVDPLDGTAYFAYGLGAFTVSIGLAKDDIPVGGVVYNPYTGDLYFATDISYFENGHHGIKRAGRISHPNDIGDSTVAINGTQYKDHERFLKLQQAFSIPHIRRNITAGFAAAEELSNVAFERRDGYAAINQRPWDIAAGGFIAEKAGAALVDFQGNPWTLETSDIIAGHPKLVEQLLRRIEEVGL